jgi:hypothetical protein
MIESARSLRGADPLLLIWSIALAIRRVWEINRDAVLGRVTRPELAPGGDS